MEEEVESREPKKKGVSLVLIIVIVLFILLLTVLGAIAFLMVSSPSDETVATPAGNTANIGNASSANSASASTQRGSDFANIGVMYPLQPFTLNLLSDSGARYVKCTIQLEQNSELLSGELEKKTAIIRDIIIRTLTSKTFEEISTTKGKERLKDELVGRINEVLTDGFIKNIYFTDFVVS